MTSDEVRIHVVPRPPFVVVHSLVAPGKKFHAFAVTGEGEETQAEASGYGATEDEAIADLEATVMAPPPPPKKLRKVAERKYHLARAVNPEQPFRSTCAIEGCGKMVIRQSGVQARRSDWRHVKSTEHF